MNQHYTLAAKVQAEADPERTQYTLMAVSEERNEKWTSEALTASAYRHALEGSQLTDAQVEEPIKSQQQVEFKAENGKHMLFQEIELHKMALRRIPNG